MADPATINALKALTKAVDDQTRVLKGIDNSLIKSVKVLEAFNSNFVEANKETNVN